MDKRNNSLVWKLVLSAAIGAAVPGVSRGQAAPGPIVTAPSASPTSGQGPAPAPAPPKAQEAPRKDFAGVWKLDRDESDDPQRRLQGRNGNGNGNGNGGGGNGPYGQGNGPFGGRRRGGIGFPGAGGGGGPYGGGGNGQNNQDRQELQALLRPAQSFGVELKDHEFDFTDDQGRKNIFYTDGRKIQKSKDPMRVEISAHVDGTRLISDEKGPGGKKVSRTFELSSTGLQLDEAISVDNGRTNYPTTIRYVYDAAPSQPR